MELISCKECGKEISENMKFCPNCGKEILIESNEPINQIAKEKKKKEKKKKHILSWIFCVFMFLSTIFVTPHSLKNVFIFLCGLFACPPFVAFIFNKWNYKLTKTKQVFICLILFIIAVNITPETTTNTVSENTTSEETNTVQKNDETQAEEQARKEAEAKAKAEEQARKEAEAKAKAEAKANEETNFKNSCKSYTFKEIARNPDNYIDKNVVFTGQVIQVSEGLFNTNKIEIRLNVMKNEYDWYDDTIYCTYTYKNNESKILEEDIITIYGTCKGSTSYISILGANITLPEVDIKYLTINE